MQVHAFLGQTQPLALVEMHGTGTPLGDPIEYGALCTAVFEVVRRGDACAISAAKSLVGHGEAAAGLCGFLRAAHSAAAGELAKICHLTSYNLHVVSLASAKRIARTLSARLTVQLACRASAGGEGRAIGVSSFAFQGTNVHAQCAMLRRVDSPKRAGSVLLGTRLSQNGWMSRLALPACAHLAVCSTRLEQQCVTFSPSSYLQPRGISTGRLANMCMEAIRSLMVPKEPRCALHLHFGSSRARYASHASTLVELRPHTGRLCAWISSRADKSHSLARGTATVPTASLQRLRGVKDERFRRGRWMPVVARWSAKSGAGMSLAVDAMHVLISVVRKRAMDIADGHFVSMSWSHSDVDARLVGGGPTHPEHVSMLKIARPDLSASTHTNDLKAEVTLHPRAQWQNAPTQSRQDLLYDMTWRAHTAFPPIGMRTQSLGASSTEGASLYQLRGGRLAMSASRPTWRAAALGLATLQSTKLKLLVIVGSYADTGIEAKTCGRHTAWQGMMNTLCAEARSTVPKCINAEDALPLVRTEEGRADPPGSLACAWQRYSAAPSSFSKASLVRLGQGRVRTLRMPQTSLLLGGLGAVGAVTRRWLQQHGQQSVASVGRGVQKGLSPGEFTEASLQLDVTLACAGIAYRRIGAGTVHILSGVLRDATLVRQTSRTVLVCLAPKLAAMRVVMPHAVASAVRSCIGYSSVASVFASAGQLAYSAANSALTAHALAWRRSGCPCLPIRWGPWDGMGMAADHTVRAQLEKSGVGLLGVHEGTIIAHKASASLCYRAPSQAPIALPLNWETVGTRRRAEDEFLSAVSVEQVPPPHGLRALDVRPSIPRRQPRLEARLSDLGLSLDAPLVDSGLDSLGILEVVNSLRETVDYCADVDVHDVFENATVRHLLQSRSWDAPKQMQGSAEVPISGSSASRGAPTLLCFPYAGLHGGDFAQLHATLPIAWAIVPIRYSGHSGGVVEGILAGMQDRLAAVREVAIVGASIGALVGIECLHRGVPISPTAFFALCAYAPHHIPHIAGATRCKRARALGTEEGGLHADLEKELILFENLPRGLAAVAHRSIERMRNALNDYALLDHARGVPRAGAVPIVVHASVNDDVVHYKRQRGWEFASHVEVSWVIGEGLLHAEGLARMELAVAGFVKRL